MIWERRTTSGRLLVPERLEPNRLDTIRLLLALGVILSHSWALLRGNDSTEPFFFLTHGSVTLGGVCVWGFFGISGLLVLRSRERSPSVVDFLLRRVRRIYPAFLVACFVTLLAVCGLDPGHGHVGLPRYLRDGLLLMRPHIPDAFAPNPIPNEPNGALYTVQLEFILYLFLAVVGGAGVRIGRVLWPVLAALGSALSASFPAGFQHVGKFGWLVDGLVSALVPFALGASVWTYREKLITDPYRQIAAATLLGIALFALPGAALRPTVQACVIYLLFAAAFSPRWREEGLARYGDFSYGTYLYGSLVQQALVFRFAAALTPVTLFALAAPLSLAMGIASYFFVERPFLRRSRHFRQKSEV